MPSHQASLPKTSPLRTALLLSALLLAAAASMRASAADHGKDTTRPVSYTHLTLPTKA